MKQERTQYIGHFGVVFMLHRFTVTPSDRPGLQHLRLSESVATDYEINTLVIDLYERMQAKGLPCEMLVAISKPLLREQADRFNEQRINIVRIASGSAAMLFKPAGALASFLAGSGAGAFVDDRLRTYHQGDVVIDAHASVSGGIGPQHSSMSLLIAARINPS
ncbi:hypothetical protein [Pseudomonas sp. DWP3-1-2]|uniref:hypothetical protein n=1 Tax=Pseudomonas sp. DWP3-1-2 TaxID=2804645 RepID=UPI003CEDEDE2